MMIMTVAFEKHGDHLAIEDRGEYGIIFQRGEDDNGKNTGLNKERSREVLEQADSSTPYSRHPKFRYKMEFQSHKHEFDYLKSEEIEGMINKVR